LSSQQVDMKNLKHQLVEDIVSIDELEDVEINEELELDSTQILFLENTKFGYNIKQVLLNQLK
jgi:hypothetical protein